METINNIELRDGNVYPDEKVLRKVLNEGYDSYAMLLDLFKKNELSYEWRYYRDGKAWLCKVQIKKRTIVWMSAWNGYMQATIYFPEKYLEKVYDLSISEETKIKIKSTKYVGKSKPCIFEIRDINNLNDFSKVMKLKIECK
ncbi:MAG: DUF3788 family protein [Actinobacteria bacterium]|nr:DUF3788 family protein [Actinomycetota bacterium]